MNRNFGNGLERLFMVMNSEQELTDAKRVACVSESIGIMRTLLSRCAMFGFHASSTDFVFNLHDIDANTARRIFADAPYIKTISAGKHGNCIMILDF